MVYIPIPKPPLYIPTIKGEAIQTFRRRVTERLMQEHKYEAKYFIGTEFNTKILNAFKKGTWREWR